MSNTLLSPVRFLEVNLRLCNLCIKPIENKGLQKGNFCEPTFLNN